MNNLDVETIYIRVSTKELQGLKSNRIRIAIGVVIAICISVALIILLIIWSNKRKGLPRILNDAQVLVGSLHLDIPIYKRQQKTSNISWGKAVLVLCSKGF